MTRTSLKLLLTAAVFGLAALALPTTEAEAGRRCCCCPPPPPPPPQKVVLVVCHPCTGCTYQVPVCVPACCQGAPAVCFEDTRIGYGRNVYQWSNGYRVVVRFPRGGGYRVVQRRV